MDDYIIKNALAVLAIISFLAALFLLIWPDPLKRINKVLKKEISTKKLTEHLDKMRDIDEQIFNLRKIIGALFLIVALMLFYLCRR